MAKWRFLAMGALKQQHKLLQDDDTLSAHFPVGRGLYQGGAGCAGAMEPHTCLGMVHEDKGGPTKRSTQSSNRYAYEKAIKIHG
jgi:hypothetical protein